MADRETRRLSFGSVAEDYDRYRPAPPPQALDWLIPPGARRVSAFLDRQPWDLIDLPLISRCQRSTRLPGLRQPPR